AAGGDRGAQHLAGRVATGGAPHDGPPPPQNDADAAVELPAEGIVADVLLKLVPLGQNLTDGWGAEGQDLRRGPWCLTAFAQLCHQSSPSLCMLMACHRARARPSVPV